MASGWFCDRGAYHVCPTCGKSFYVMEPDLWVYKMTPSLNGQKDKIYFFCKYSHLKQFREDYEQDLKLRRRNAAYLRHKNKLNNHKQLEEYLAGKCCGECRYCSKSKYGFYDCDVTPYSVNTIKAACRKFKPKDQVIGNGNSGQEAVT